MNKKISFETAELMQPDNKLGILATCDDEGYPHLSLITSIQALGEDKITFGQFCTGLSKEHIKKRPEVGFLVLSGDMRWVRGSARYTHSENTGEVFDEYNNKPLFRYNSYCGFNQVHFLELSGISDIEKLPMAKIVSGALLTRARASFTARRAREVLTPYGQGLFAELSNLKFLSWCGAQGELEIVPVIQAANAGSDRLALVCSPYGELMRGIPEKAACAVFGMNLQMESVLVKGRFSRPNGMGIVDIERVYNSMLPKAGYIYPREARPQAVTQF